MGFRDDRTKIFQWNSCNYVKIANLAEFEYQIPSLTWSSELCYVFRDIFGYPSLFKLDKNNTFLYYSVKLSSSSTNSVLSSSCSKLSKLSSNSLSSSSDWYSQCPLAGFEKKKCL